MVAHRPVVRLLQNSPVLSFNTSYAHAYMHTTCIVSHALLELDTSFFTVTTDRAPDSFSRYDTNKYRII